MVCRATGVRPRRRALRLSEDVIGDLMGAQWTVPVVPGRVALNESQDVDMPPIAEDGAGWSGFIIGLVVLFILGCSLTWLGWSIASVVWPGAR